MTNEEHFKLPEQPAETCPLIDKIIKKINLIDQSTRRYERDEHDELKDRLNEIEWAVSGLINDMEVIRKHVESIRSWGQAWKEKALELIIDE